MNPEDFERLVDQVLSSPEPHPCGPDLPGTSPAMKALGEELARVRTDLARPPADNRIGVVLLHPPAPAWLGLQLLRLCAVSPDSTCELHPCSPVYNAGLLFGQICRPGRFEIGGSSVLGVAGLEGMGNSQAKRLRAHLEEWWVNRQTSSAPYHLVMTAQEHPGIAATARAAGARVVRVAPLVERREDFPHVLHALASRWGGSLGDFDALTFPLLADHRWDGDLLELDGVIERLYSQNGSAGSSLELQWVRELLQEPFAPEPILDSTELWAQVRDGCQSCDALTNGLVGVPFFAAAANEMDPFDDPSPLGQFFRVVSWAYQRFHEAAGSKLEFLCRARQATCPGDVSEAKRLRQLLSRFRQHQQHHAPAGHAGYHDVRTWLRQVCGRETPDAWHHELCVTTILRNIIGLTEVIQRLLASVADDPGRAQLIEQWQEELNLSWPPKRRRRFICKRLEAVAGWRVNPRAVADRWLQPVQTRLRELSRDPDQEREKALERWLDEQLRNDPDSQPLVKGYDLVDLGVPDTKRGDLLEELQRAQLQGGRCRDDLLELVRSRMTTTT